MLIDYAGMKPEELPMVLRKGLVAGTFDPDYHSPLMADRVKILATAGIPESILWAPLSAFVTQQEIDWVVNYKAHVHKRKYGLIHVGLYNQVSVMERQSVMVASLLRNYQDARLITMSNTLKMLKEESMPIPRVLAIPDFAPGSADAKAVPEWIARMVYSMLVERYQGGKQTILGVSDMPQVTKIYGVEVYNHLWNSFTRIKEVKQ